MARLAPLRRLARSLAARHRGSAAGACISPSAARASAPWRHQACIVKNINRMGNIEKM
jgi:hypothetical protein